MKKILIVNRTQFGYNIDSYNYCHYLKDKYKITYLCIDKGHTKIQEEGIDIEYILEDGGYFSRGFKFFNALYNNIRKNDYALVFLFYFPMVSFIKLLLPKQRYIFDIRTGSVNISNIKRNIYNILMSLESRLFKNITVISECLMYKLNLNVKNCHILPLGSDALSKVKKDFSNMKLLYVGTFTNRNIEQTLDGLSMFLNHYKVDGITYDIFGDGPKYDSEKILMAIKKYNLKEIVTMHGRKTHNEIQEYYDKCTVGVSYIPKTIFYDCQPPTKTYEYVNAGMVCIATSTSENKKLINKKNGILCDDNALSFYNALSLFYNTKNQYVADDISKTLKKYNWKNIVNDNLNCYIKNLLRNSL